MKTRIVHTNMHFEDDWFNTLPIGYRYLFMYLFTNTHIGQTGAYKLPERVALLETGATKEEWQDALQKFKEAGKIATVEDYIFVVNAQKHSNYSGPKNQSAYLEEFKRLPQSVQDTISIHYVYPIDTTINHKSEIINDKSKIENIKQEMRNRVKTF